MKRLTANTRYIDVSGMTIGNYKIISKIGPNKYGFIMWQCKCLICGSILPKSGTVLVSPRGPKPGPCTCKLCKKITHRLLTSDNYRISEYNTWERLKNKCGNPKDRQYKDYGQRGIFLCDRWKNDFSKFYEDMGPRPTKFHSIDRIDNNDGYYKENCRWATPKQQSRNTRQNVQITAFGKTQCSEDWALEYNQKGSVIRDRIRHGWNAEDAITLPPHQYGNATIHRSTIR